MSFICHIHNYTEYNQQWNLFSAFNPSKCTHLEQWAANTAVPGEQLGVQPRGQTDRQTERDRQTDRQTERDRQTDSLEHSLEGTPPPTPPACEGRWGCVTSGVGQEPWERSEAGGVNDNKHFVAPLTGLELHGGASEG